MGSSASRYDDSEKGRYNGAPREVKVLAGKDDIPTFLTGMNGEYGNGRKILARRTERLPVALKGPKTEFLLIPDGQTNNLKSQALFRIPGLATVFELALQDKTGNDLFVLRMTFAEKLDKIHTWRLVATQNPPVTVGVCSPYNSAHMYTAEILERAEEASDVSWLILLNDLFDLKMSLQG
ncbi:uncharacterized protein LOC143030167 [Oratosquilla oratoria]|uniref:uncharacterized protein LOC143030167 n=1 Tax=Oratosquilla oratoria TaxID=337810 RepID=UPI003F75B4AD